LNSQFILKITEDNINLILYFYQHPQFTVENICEKFEFQYQTFFRVLKEWVKQGYIIEERQPPVLGEIKYKYSLSEIAIDKLMGLQKKISEV
jgi:predicted transcriptional regulator